MDLARRVSCRGEANQWSPRERSRWEANDIDGQTREGETSGKKANQAVRHGRSRGAVSAGTREANARVALASSE